LSNRFHHPELPAEGRFRLDADESRHLLRVSRRGVGDRVEVFDGRGLSVSALVVASGKNSAELEVEGPPILEPPPDCSIEIGAAAPKGDRFDWLVEKAVELGVVRLVPLTTERSVVDPRASKLDRLRRTIIEASKQSGRSRLMELSSPTTLQSFLEAREGVRLVADPRGAPPKSWPRIDQGSAVRLVVGPEGGLTDAETALAEGLGWTPVRLGPHILRVETAVLAGAAAILARLG